MKIGNSTKSVPGVGSTGSDKNQVEMRTRKKSSDSSAQSGSAVSSDGSYRASEVRSGLGDLMVVDSARVQEIKQAIAEGRFTVNTAVVADHLLETARELLRNQLG